MNEDVGTVQLCVSFNQADNISDTVTATITNIQENGGLIYPLSLTTGKILYLGGDFNFEDNALPFTISTNDRRCFSVTVNDDGENEFDETFSFHLYQQNGHFTDTTRIIIHDNEEGKTMQMIDEFSFQ